MRLLVFLLICITASVRGQTITRLEYYFDSDPGFGNGVSIPITAAADLTQDFTIPLNTVSEGFHKIYMRAKSSTGMWSIPVSKTVIVQRSSQTASVFAIDKLEYFLDTDPGFANGISIPISNATDLTLDYSISLTGTSEGFHTIYLRAKSNNQLWSHTISKPVFVQSNAQSTLAPQLKKIEYFLDTDPGTGNGILVPVSTTIVDQAILIDLSSATPGFHALYIRTQDIYGKWSLPLLKPFFIEKSGSNVIAVEYYFNDGTANSPVRIYSSFTPGKDIIIDFAAALDGLLPNTSYEIHFIAINSDGQRSKEVVHTFVTPPIVCDPISPPIGTGASRCGAGSIDLLASGAGTNQNYQWYTSPTGGVAITGINGNTLTTPSLINTTTYYVSILNGTCESVRTAVTATILSQPPQPIITTTEPINAGVVTICLQPITLSAATGFVSYVWSTGQTTQQITTLQPGNYSVIVTDAGGCSSPTSDVIQVIKSITCVNNPPSITAVSLKTIIGGKLMIDLSDLISDPDNNLDAASLQVVGSATQKGGKINLTGFNLEIEYSSVNFSGSDLVTIKVCDLLNECIQENLEILVVGDIVIYNGISPNSDNKNDTWIIEYIDLFPDTQTNRVTLYNRWGDVVWENSNYNNTSVVFTGLNKNGSELSTGSYFYKIEFFEGRRESITGYLSLKR